MNYVFRFFFTFVFFSSCSFAINCSQAKQKTLTNDLSMLQNICVGSLTGALEVSVNQPLFYFKNKLQTGSAISKNPRDWYKGYGVNVCSMAPITAVQVFADAELKRAMQGFNDLTEMQKLACASAAGAFSSFVSSPSELVMLYQQNSSNSFVNSFEQLTNNPKKGYLNLTRGVWPVACRDGGFAAGYLAVSPYLKKQFMKQTNNETVASLGSGVVSGVLTAGFTHPFDTVKTRLQNDTVKDQLHHNIELQNATVKAELQNDINRVKYNNSLDVVKHVYNKEGFKGFYKGFTPRALRVASAVTLMSWATQELTEFIKNN